MSLYKLSHVIGSVLAGHHARLSPLCHMEADLVSYAVPVLMRVAEDGSRAPWGGFSPADIFADWSFDDPTHIPAAPDVGSLGWALAECLAGHTVLTGPPNMVTTISKTNYAAAGRTAPCLVASTMPGNGPAIWVPSPTDLVASYRPRP